MRKITIVQRLLPHYRIPFFNLLKKRLRENGIRLELIYGNSDREGLIKNDLEDLDWATKINTKNIGFGPAKLYWQPCLSEIESSELVVVEQANRNLVNYYLQFTRLFQKKRKVAFWGHGLNKQAYSMSIANLFKLVFIKQCDWWFAYTGGVKAFLVENGFPEIKITDVQNAVDTRVMLNDLESIDLDEIECIKSKFNITSENVGIFCGGIYHEKRVDFLLNVNKLIQSSVPDYQFIVIGDGIESNKVKQAAKKYPWIKYLGTKFGREKAALFKVSKVLLMPGLAGLVVLDSFAFKTPLITTNYEFHSPEIEYIKDGVNGIITQNSVEEYSKKVIDLLRVPSKIEALQNGCEKSIERYTIEQMVDNFLNGIIKCLNS